jgi:hypothetical protein
MALIFKPYNASKARTGPITKRPPSTITTLHKGSFRLRRKNTHKGKGIPQDPLHYAQIA